MPTLKSGDIAVMDNLGSHKRSAVSWAIRTTGAKPFFRPSHIRGLVRLEQICAKPKNLLCKALERPVDATWKLRGALLQCWYTSHKILIGKWF